MTMIRTVAPEKLAVDLDLARLNLRVDGDYMDALITTWLQGITSKLEHDVGQVFMEQTWEVRLPQLPSGREPIELPHPAMEVVSISFLDADEKRQLLPVDEFRMEVVKYESVLRPMRGAVWPPTPVDGSVVITVKCGYGSTSDATPETAKLFILGKLVEQFDPTTKAERETVQSVYLDRLVDGLKTYS